MLPPTFHARVASSRPLSPSVREIGLARVGGMFDFEPGQWVSVIVNGPEGELRRAYSVASPPRGDASFEIAVTRVESGIGSKVLHALAVGDRVQVIGPQGFFTRPKVDPPPALMIGTGTGLAPLRSMIHAAAHSGVPLWLLFGARTETDLLYRDDLAKVAATHPNVRVHETLSRGTDAWTGRRGYVQAHARSLYEELAREGGAPPHVYVCGLERMVGSVRALFRSEMALPRQLVHSERYD